MSKGMYLVHKPRLAIPLSIVLWLYLQDGVDVIESAVNYLEFNLFLALHTNDEGGDMKGRSSIGSK